MFGSEGMDSQAQFMFRQLQLSVMQKIADAPSLRTLQTVCVVEYTLLLPVHCYLIAVLAYCEA